MLGRIFCCLGETEEQNRPVQHELPAFAPRNIAGYPMASPPHAIASSGMPVVHQPLQFNAGSGALQTTSYGVAAAHPAAIQGSGSGANPVDARYLPAGQVPFLSSASGPVDARYMPNVNGQPYPFARLPLPAGEVDSRYIPSHGLLAPLPTPSPVEAPNPSDSTSDNGPPDSAPLQQYAPHQEVIEFLGNGQSISREVPIFTGNYMEFPGPKSSGVPSSSAPSISPTPTASALQWQPDSAPPLQWQVDSRYIPGGQALPFPPTSDPVDSRYLPNQGGNPYPFPLPSSEYGDVDSRYLPNQGLQAPLPTPSPAEAPDPSGSTSDHNPPATFPSEMNFPGPTPTSGELQWQSDSAPPIQWQVDPVPTQTDFPNWQGQGGYDDIPVFQGDGSDIPVFQGDGSDIPVFQEETDLSTNLQWQVDPTPNFDDQSAAFSSAYAGYAGTLFGNLPLTNPDLQAELGFIAAQDQTQFYYMDSNGYDDQGADYFDYS